MAAGRAETLTRVGTGRHLRQRRRQRRRVGGGHEQTRDAMTDGRTDGAHVGRHHRHAARHRLEDDVGQAVAIAGAIADRGDDDHVCTRIFVRKRVVRRRAAERDVVGDAERARLRLEAIALRSFADDAEAPRHPKHRQRVEQHVKPLLLHQPPDGEHVQNAGGRSPFAGEPPHVDAVRHQIDARAAAVELGGDVGIARDDAGGAARPIVQLRPIDFPRVTGVHAEAERHAQRARQIGRDNGRGVREVRVHARDPRRVEPPSGFGGLFRRRAR